MPQGSDSGADSVTSRKINRRDALRLVGAGSVGLLAGCPGSTGGGGDGGSSDGGSGGDGGSQELGERVPAMTLSFFTGHSASPFMEDAVPILQNSWEQIGVTVEPKPTDVSEVINEVWSDQRVSPVQIWSHGADPARLDSQTMLRRFKIDYAGANGQPNVPNYASCEASDYITQVTEAPDEETKREATNNALERISEDLAIMPMMPATLQGAYNSNQVNLSPGSAGLATTNPFLYLTGEATNDDNTIVANHSTSALARLNMLTIGDPRASVVFSNTFHSPLLQYNQEYELENVLASGYETGDGGRTATFTLRDDITFHNGDPITAEDVKWSFDNILGNADVFPYPEDLGQEITALDERTVEFSYDEPYVSVLTKTIPRWGILHRDTWSGLESNPGDFEPDPNTFIGSGPYEIRDYSASEFLSLTPYGDHPVFDPQSDLFFQAFQNAQTAVEAFINEEVGLITDLAAGNISRIEDADTSGSEVSVTLSFVPDPLYPQMSFAPSKFREFRAAIGASTNLDEINDIARFGASEPDPYATPFMKPHPYRPPNERLTRYSEDTSGDADAARQLLADAGWGWDNQDRLHYPPDADLSPLWPEGEEPGPDSFPCINSDGEYVGESA
ncbi:ABC transporter substrate-binding protein [Haloarcula marina]|uniref:ABC transporter substrate-binding protein n=1 Tax=Haloarcula marina TaxID=2961574 RepID=UPI0020B72FAC|nr:ABC transporter substrate-binding protein [Halomicroarcula marina]